jgi:phosphoribosylaminoimidazolecarboxamide formyltransferase/IMP cyclohydrolase
MVQDIVYIKRALISVSDKSGLANFLKDLNPSERGIEIISSGGTAKSIRELGYSAMDVSEYTGFPESPNGLVKTLHPKVHGGLLLEPEVLAHQGYMQTQNIPPIDLVVVNLYPFQKTVDAGKPFEDCRENIDIGGPSMIRSAAKGFKRVAILTDWADAAMISGGKTDLQSRIVLAGKAFEHTARYDRTIANHFTAQDIVATGNKYLGA